MAHFGGVLLCQFCRELVECLLVRRSKVGQHGRRLEERETESECVCVCGGGSRSAIYLVWLVAGGLPGAPTGTTRPGRVLFDVVGIGPVEESLFTHTKILFKAGACGSVHRE